MGIVAMVYMEKKRTVGEESCCSLSLGFEGVGRTRGAAPCALCLAFSPSSLPSEGN